MIRRLEIAQSTLHPPPLLFLDEPTTGLDPIGAIIPNKKTKINLSVLKEYYNSLTNFY